MFGLIYTALALVDLAASNGWSTLSQHSPVTCFARFMGCWGVMLPHISMRRSLFAFILDTHGRYTSYWNSAKRFKAVTY